MSVSPVESRQPTLRARRVSCILSTNATAFGSTDLSCYAVAVVISNPLIVFYHEGVACTVYLGYPSVDKKK